MARHDMPCGYGLREFTDFLVAVANEQEKPRLTEEECKLLRRHGERLGGAVAELTEMLVDRQPADVQEYRLHKVWLALGSACVIISCQAENPIAIRKMRERAAHATAVAKAPSQKTDEIIVAVAKPVWCKHPSFTPWRIAGDIGKAVNERLQAEELPTLKRHAIDHRLKKLRHLILVP